MEQKLKIVEIPVDEIKEYENNPRENEEAATKVAQSIIEFGFINPIAVTPDKVIIAGHARYKAAKTLGMEKVPCIIHDISEEDARVARIAENRTREFSTWNLQMLMEGLKAIQNPAKTSFFGPSTKDRQYFVENRILAFGKIEITIDEEDGEIFESHFADYLAKHNSHLGFVNYMVGGLADA